MCIRFCSAESKYLKMISLYYVCTKLISKNIVNTIYEFIYYPRNFEERNQIVVLVSIWDISFSIGFYICFHHHHIVISTPSTELWKDYLRWQAHFVDVYDHASNFNMKILWYVGRWLAWWAKAWRTENEVEKIIQPFLD